MIFASLFARLLRLLAALTANLPALPDLFPDRRFPDPGEPVPWGDDPLDRRPWT